MKINPYESPQHPAERINVATSWWLQAVQFCGLSVATSVTLGALANLLNGWVCPEYFVIVMGWDPDSNVWLRSVLQGAIEGLVIGGVVSVAFFGIGSVLTRFRLTFRRAARYLAIIVLAGVICAAVFGLGLMSLSELFLMHFEPVEARFRFGWVAGSISGLEQGGALSAFFALIVLVVRDWGKNHVSAADAKTAAAD